MNGRCWRWRDTKWAPAQYAQVQQSVQQLGGLEDLSAGKSSRTGRRCFRAWCEVKDEGMPGIQAPWTPRPRARPRARTSEARHRACSQRSARALPTGVADVRTGGRGRHARAACPRSRPRSIDGPESAEFAELLVRMNSIVGNTADVFKYAVAEQRLAATEAERARATARVERLRAQLKSAQ